jgi:hypothetical protein
LPRQADGSTILPYVRACPSIARHESVTLPGGVPCRPKRVGRGEGNGNLSERDYMPRWVKRLLIALAVILILWSVGPLIFIYLAGLFS